MPETLYAENLEAEFPGLSPEEIARKIADEETGYYSVFLGRAYDNAENRLYIRVRTRADHYALLGHHPYVVDLRQLFKRDEAGHAHSAQGPCPRLPPSSSEGEGAHLEAARTYVAKARSVGRADDWIRARLQAAGWTQPLLDHLWASLPAAPSRPQSVVAAARQPLTNADPPLTRLELDPGGIRLEAFPQSRIRPFETAKQDLALCRAIGGQEFSVGSLDMPAWSDRSQLGWVQQQKRLAHWLYTVNGESDPLYRRRRTNACETVAVRIVAYLMNAADLSVHRLFVAIADVWDCQMNPQAVPGPEIVREVRHLFNAEAPGPVAYSSWSLGPFEQFAEVFLERPASSARIRQQDMASRLRALRDLCVRHLRMVGGDADQGAIAFNMLVGSLRDGPVPALYDKLVEIQEASQARGLDLPLEELLGVYLE